VIHSDGAEKDFRLSGRSFRKRRQDFITAVSGERPKPLQTWAVNMDGTLYPPKQVVARVTGFNDFTSHQANAVLRRFGFEPYSITSEEGFRSSQLGDSGTGASGESAQQAPDRRLTALREAIQFASNRPDSTADDVLKAAEEFETWLSR